MSADLILNVYFENLYGGEYKLTEGGFFLESYECDSDFNIKVITFGGIKVLNVDKILKVFPELNYDDTDNTYNGIIGKSGISYYEALTFLRYETELNGLGYIQSLDSYIEGYHDWQGVPKPIAKTAGVINPLYDELNNKFGNTITVLKKVVNEFLAHSNKVEIEYKDLELAKTIVGDFKAFSAVVDQFLIKATNVDKKHEVFRSVIQSGKRIFQHFKNAIYQYNLTLKYSKLETIKVNSDVQIENLKFTRLTTEDHPQSGYSTKYTVVIKNVVMTVLVSSSSGAIYVLDGVKFDKPYKDMQSTYMSWHETVFARNTNFSATKKDDLQIKHLILADKQTYDSISKVVLSKYQNLVRISDDENYNAVFSTPSTAAGVVQALNDMYKNAKSSLNLSLHTTESTSDLLGYKYIAGNEKYKDFDANLVATLAGLLIK